MRLMNINNGAMVKVVGMRGDRIVIIHPTNGKAVEAPANLYIHPPRCLAEREMARQKIARATWWQRQQDIENRRREEEELKEAVRSGEVQAILYKNAVFPILDGDGVAAKLIEEIRGLSKREKKGTLKKKMIAELMRRCRHWQVAEIFGPDWQAEMDWAYGEWELNEKVVARWLQQGGAQ